MSDLTPHVVTALADRVIEVLENRQAGHCLQIPDIPESLANDACRVVSKKLKEPDAARVVVPAPRAKWQARPAKIVELRNEAEAAGGRLAVFVPADQHVAAEDSFGRSTFEVLDVSELYDEVVDRLRRELQKLAPDLAEQAESVLGSVRDEQRFGVTARDAAAYLARLVDSPSEREIGRAVVELGLLPDLSLAETESADLGVRLLRNLQHAETLTENAPPADRLQGVSVLDIPEATQMTEALVDALEDGTADRRTLARRLDRDGDEPVDFGPLVTKSAETVQIQVEIAALAGDFAEGSDPPTLMKANSALRVRYRCRPSARNLVGLKELRLRLVSMGPTGETADAGVELVKRANGLPANPEGTWTMRVPTQDLDEGLHKVVLEAIDENNYTLAQADSEAFGIKGTEAEAVEIRSAVSIDAARVDARVLLAGANVRGAVSVEVQSGEKPDGDRMLPFLIGFEGVPGRWQMPVSRLLALVERWTLGDPRSLARYVVSLQRGEPEATVVPDGLDEVPEDFLEARAEFFDAVTRNQYTVHGDEAGPLMALADLRGTERVLQRYVGTWAAALDQATSPAALRALLSVDQVNVSEAATTGGVLVGPTHPLRAAWLARYQQELAEWAEHGPERVEDDSHFATLLSSLAPTNLPHVVSSDHRELRYLEPVDLYWAAWAPPAAPDAGAFASAVRQRLHLSKTAVGAIRADDLVQRVRRYLAAHPYVDLLKLNFVHPGHGDVVLDALLALQGDPATANLRYVLRLFATDLARTELGRGLDEFMADPESTKGKRRDAADAFLASTDDPLTPKLTYSKHPVADLLASPERFPAHISFFLDWFELDAVPVPPVEDRRSFFANGLVIDPVNVYRTGSGELNPQWDEHVVAPADSPDWFVQAYAACERATAKLLGSEATGTVPAVRLELDRIRRSIIDAVHDKSDWVVVIDPVFSDDYLDSPSPTGDAPRYLIDASDPGALEATRRITVSTRSHSELQALISPILDKYGLKVETDRVGVLLDALQALSPGLPLRLLNNRTQALEALSLALASLYLSAQGVLRRAVVIPLDMHQDLFRDRPAADVPLDLRRTDLAVVQIDAASRKLAVNLIEVKARGRLPEATPPELIEQIDGQLENSRAVLRSRLFGADLRAESNSLAGAIAVRRVTRLLTRYLDRAVRHEFMQPNQATTVRPFLATLDNSFSLAFAKHALIFDLEGESKATERVDDIRVVRIGRHDVLDLLNRAQTPLGTQFPSESSEVVPTAIPGLADPLGDRDDERATAAEAVPALTARDLPEPEAGDTQLEPDTGDRPKPEPAEEPADEGPRIEDVLLLGGARTSAQFGIVGRMVSAGRDVAFDVDDTAVISVFGVQGAGKSYTVGDLLEAALIRERSLNRLPHPLASVVFHYSTTETYSPEFAAMAEANTDADAVRRLSDEYGAAATAVSDVRILVPEGTVAERQTEFAGLEVHPLLVGPEELNINDWKLLMGVEGGDQLYVKAMSNVFRRLRGKLTLKSLKAALKDDVLNRQQRTLAETRLTFVEAFVRDGAGVTEHVAPGRLLIVDVRDPYMEEEEVLALFMVVLRLASQAQTAASESFNKLIVFDEAHKYMDNRRLTKAIVESVREMRHKGTSVVIASQNPPSVPREIIELSSVVIAHRFTAPLWLEHVRKVNAAFGELTPPQLATLSPGEAFVWAGGTDQFKRPQKVRFRPRLTQHGGATRRASGN